MEAAPPPPPVLSWIASPPDSRPPRTLEVTLFGNSVFTEAIKIKMRLYLIRVGPNPMTGVLIGKENGDTQTHRGKTRQRQTQEEGRVRMEAENRLMKLHAKECRVWPATTMCWKKQGRILPASL